MVESVKNNLEHIQNFPTWYLKEPTIIYEGLITFTILKDGQLTYLRLFNEETYLRKCSNMFVAFFHVIFLLMALNSSNFNNLKSIKHLYILHQENDHPRLTGVPPSPAEPWNHAGHSNRDLYIPNRFKSPTTFPKGHLTTPTKIQKIARMMNFQDEGIFFLPGVVSIFQV